MHITQQIICILLVNLYKIGKTGSMPRRQKIQHVSTAEAKLIVLFFVSTYVLTG